MPRNPAADALHNPILKSHRCPLSGEGPIYIPRPANETLNAGRVMAETCAFHLKSPACSYREEEEKEEERKGGSIRRYCKEMEERKRRVVE